MKKHSEQNLDRIKKSVDRVYFLSEVAYDADFFNPQAYETLIKLIAFDPAKVHIVLDGVWTRLDRPEILREKKKDGDFGLTFWGITRKGAKKVSKHIPSQRQVRWMFGQEFKNLGLRLAELRERLPDATIVLSVDSDDTQHSINAFLHEAELLNQYQMQGKLGGLKGSRKASVSGQKAAEKRLSDLKKEKAGKRAQAAARKEIRDVKQSIKDIDKSIIAYTIELQLFREKKTRPMTQYLRTRYMKLFRGICQRLCRQYGVTLVTKRSTLDFGKLRVDYAHSRHASWAPVKDIAKRMVSSVHGLAKLIASDTDAALAATVSELKDQTPSKRPDIIACSGHFGQGWKRLQKLRVGAAEMNFQNQGMYDPELADEYATLLLALPFEDQAKIAEYTDGGKPDRMSHGMPVHTKSHAALTRNQQGSVSGLTIAWKGEDDVVETRWIQYQDFVDGTVLNRPIEYAAIYISSDEHLGSKEEMPIVRDGFSAEYRKDAFGGFMFFDRKGFARGYLSGGDTGEANSDKWVYRYMEQRDPTTVLAENIKLLTTLDRTDLDAVFASVLKTTSDAMGGSVESARDVMERVASFYGQQLRTTIESGSTLQAKHGSVPGNHFGETNKRSGIEEDDFFIRDVKKEHGDDFVFEVGRSHAGKPDIMNTAQVWVGGYSNARVLNIPRYGLDVDGHVLFGPINLLMHHDPKGSEEGGIVGTGKSAHADLTISGHTHENYVKTYSTGPNTFGVAYRVCTLQGETSTGIVYAESVPRTPAGHRVIMPRPGDFSERSMPASYLQKIGRTDLRGKIESAIQSAN